MSIFIDAEKALQEKMYKRAYSLYSLVLPKEENKAPILQKMAVCLYHLGNIDEALKAAYSALELDSRFAKPHLVLAYIFAHRGNLNESKKEIKIALELDSELVDALVFYGQLLIAENDLSSALSILQKATELGPTNWFAYYNLGLTYHLQKHHKEALLNYKLSFRVQPSVQGFLRILELYSTTYLLWVPAIALLIYGAYAKNFLVIASLAAYVVLLDVLRIIWDRDKRRWINILLTIFFLFIIYGFLVLGWGG